MSHLTSCNYCLMRAIRKQAKAEDKVVHRRTSSFMDGTDVYVLPKEVKMPKRIVTASDELPNGDEFHEKYFRAWFMEMPDSCRC